MHPFTSGLFVSRRIFVARLILIICATSFALVYFAQYAHAASNASADLISSGQAIIASSSPVAVIGLNLASTTETFTGIRLSINPSAGFSTSTDLAALATATSSSIAIYRDNKTFGIQGTFDSADLVVVLSGAPTWTGATTTLTFATSETVPVNDTGVNVGNDYFVVIQTKNTAVGTHAVQFNLYPGEISWSIFSPTGTPTALTTNTLTLDTTPPTVSSTGPTNGSLGVPISTFPSATFSESMDFSTLTSANITLVNHTAGDAPVGAAINGQPSGFSMVVSNPPTYASTTITRFARPANTVFGSFQITASTPILPQGGSYSVPALGDIVYFQHDTFPPELGLVTNATLTGGTFAVNNFNLFGGQSLTKFATASSTGLVSAATVLKLGSLVVTNTAANPTSNRYAWHVVTTSAAVNNASLRLDNAAAAPTYASTTATSFSTITPTATTTVNSSNQLAASIAFAVGDLVFASTTANTDNMTGYAWHIVTAAETVTLGAAPSTLRLDNGAAAPTFAPNTMIAQLSPGTQGAVSETSTSFSFGDIMFTKTTANAGSNNAYAFHIVSSGNNGVGGAASTALRLDNSASNLANNTNYILTIGTGVKDKPGNALAAPTTVSFTTGATGGTDITPPFVQGSQPQQGSQTFAPNAPLALTFSVDMATSGSGSVTNSSNNIGLYADDFGALGTQVSTTNTYTSSTRTVSIAPGSNLTINKSYILRAATSVQSATGALLPQEYRLNFRTASTTDTVPPTVLGVFPAASATNVSRSSTIMIGFSEDMDPSKITTSTVTLSGGISGIVSYNPQSRSASFAPTTQLAAGTLYTITVTTGVKDLAGNALASTYTSTFTTDSVVDATPPSIVFANADNFSIAVTFSESMKQGGGPNAADTIANYTLESPAGSSIALGGQTVIYDGSTKTALIRGLSLQSTKDFKVTVSNVAQDLAGNGMDTSGTPAKNTSFGTVADSAITGGQLGPGGGPTMSASAQGQNPTRVTPTTRVAGVASNYQVQFLAGTSIPVGGTIVLTFPSGFDINKASVVTAGTQSFCNSDINGPMTGTVTIASLATSTSAGTVTLTTGGADTGSNAFLCFDLAGIVNSTIPSSSGDTVDIKTRAVTNLALLETKTSAPFFLGTAGSNTLTVHVFHDDNANTTKDAGEEIANASVYLFSPSFGGQSTTTNASGVATFNSLSNGDYQIGLSPSGLSGFALNFAPQPVTVSGDVTKKIIVSVAPRTITGTIYGPASTKLDVFGTTQNGFAKTTVTTNSTGGTINGVSYGGSVAYSLGVQNNSTYQVGVGPSVPEATQIPGAPPPPPPTFNFMPPPPLTVAVATADIAGKNFTLTAAGNSIVGTVKDSAGSAVSNAGVFCRPSGSDSSGTSIGFGTGGQTGTNGSFTVKVVPGLYVCGVFKPGMPSVPDQQVTIASGGTQTPASLDFTLGVSSSNLTITGTIKDDGGNAVPYAGVSARKVNSTSDTSLVGGGTSNFVGGPADANGAYTLYVTAGTWVIEAFAPGVGRLGTKQVTVSSSSLSGQDFSAQTLNLGSITGSATQAGAGVQGVMVRAETSNGSSGNMTNTANGGTYTLKVPAGTYTLKCFFPGIGESTPTTGIIVTASTETPNKNCAIAAPITITVQVTDGTNPVSNAFVDVRNSDGFGNSIGVSTTTGANAIYTISVAPGTYSVRVGHPAYGLIGTKTATTTQTLTFTTTSGVLFPVTGTVKAGGSPLTNAWVSVIGTPTGQTNTINVGAQTDATGAFSVSVPAGTYKVRALKPGYQSSADTSATVTAATAVGTLTVTASARTIAGTVTLGGSGVSGAYIDATDGGSGFSIAQSDASGVYSLAVGDGTWTLHAHSQGYGGTLSGIVVSGSNVTGQNIALGAIAGFTVKPERQENVTPTAGGLLTNADIGSSFKLNIPANALGTSANAGTVTTQLNTAMPTPQTGAILSKNAVTIGATDSSGQPIKNLNDTVTVVVPYTPGDIPSGYSEANMVLGVWNDATQSYDSLPTTIDTTAHTLSASVSHFSDFAPLLPAASNPVAAAAAPAAVAAPNGSIGWFAGSSSGATTNTTVAPVATNGSGAPAVSPYTRVLRIGMTGDDVVALQTFLIRKGLMKALPPTSSGIFGPATKKALAAYQRSVGLSTVGTLGPLTKAKIESETATVSAAGTSSASTPAPASGYTRTLSLGSSGPDVAQLQAFLQTAGFLTTSLGTGKAHFGLATKKAVKQYQASIGLEATGIVGPKTRAALNAATAVTQ